MIDSNTISAVFNKKNSQHADFKSILRWIILDKANIIIGGTKYQHELKKLKNYLNIISELNKVNKAYSASKKEVDLEVIRLKSIEKSQAFNDAHLVALIIISESRILCSNDSTSFKFITNKSLYPNDVKLPKIYTNQYHSPRLDILVEKNLSTKCSHRKLSKKQAQLFIDWFEL